MSPAKALALKDALAPVWRQLDTWMQQAVTDHQHSRDHLTREESAELRRWVFVLEGMLRRLVLLAATAEEVDVKPGWSLPAETPPAADDPRDDADAPAEHPADTTSRPPRKLRRTFRLFSVPRRKRALRRSVARTHARRRAHIRKGAARKGRLSSPSDPLTSRSQARTPATGAHTETPDTTDSTDAHRQTTERVHVPILPPELSPEQFEACYRTLPPATAADRDAAIARETPRESVPRPPPANPTGPRIERKTEPELLPTAPLLERLAWLADLARNRERLIRRAAIVMARHREIAYRLSLTPAPKARGLMAASAELFGVLIPLHDAFCKGMSYYALSYTEPDTS